MQLSVIDSCATLHTDAQMLTFALGNWLDNACKYSVPLSTISVALQQVEHQGTAGWHWQVVNVASPDDLPDRCRLFD